MRKHIIILAFFISIIVLASNTFAFLTTFQPVKERIYPDESAEYTVTIFNTGTTTQRYTISIEGDVRWILDVLPSVISVPPNSSANATLRVTPRRSSFLSGSLGFGAYNIPLLIKEKDTGNYERHSLFVYILPYESPEIGYSPVIKLSVDYPKEQDPREPFILTLILSNKNIIQQSVDITIDSKLFHKSFNVEFQPLESKRFELVFELDPTTAPGRYNFTISIKKGNKSISYEQRLFTIKPYSDIVIDKNESLSRALVGTVIYKIKNNGNAPKEVFLPYSSWFFKEIITSHPSLEKKVLNGTTQKGFYFVLNPQEEKEIVIKTHYWVYVLILLAIFIGVVLYYLFRSPLVIEKEAVAIKRHEGVSEIKVTLKVRNRSMAPLFKIVIHDFVPKIATIDRSYNYVGTLPPKRISTHATLGERISWEIETMEPFEERLLTYKIKTKLDVLGDMELPRAKARFETKRGIRATNSNRARIG